MCLLIDNKSIDFRYYLGSDCNSFIIAKSKKVSEISSHLLFRLFTYFSLFLSLKLTVRYRQYLALNGTFAHSMYYFIQGHCRENIKTQFCLSKLRKTFKTITGSRSPTYFFWVAQSRDLIRFVLVKAALLFLGSRKVAAFLVCVEMVAT